MSIYDPVDPRRALALSTALTLGHNLALNVDDVLASATEIHGWLTREVRPVLSLTVDKCRDLVVLLDTALASGQHTGRSAKTAREVIAVLAEQAV